MNRAALRGPAFAVLSAVLLVLVFPKFSITWLAPVCLVPLLVAIANEANPKRRALLGWAGGIVYWAGACYWIRNVLEQFGGMNIGLVWLAYFLYALARALPWAAFAWLAGYVMPSRWAVLGVAALWTGLERVYGPFSFAWLVLGNAGIDMGIPMRLAPITGVYGLSFVLAMMNVAVALLLLRRPRRDLLPLLLLAGLYLLPKLPDIEQGTEIAVLSQPDVQETREWTGTMLETTIRGMAIQSLNSTLQAKPAPKLILWPEVPAPFYFETDPFLRDQVAQLARVANADVLLGAVGRAPGHDVFNSVFLVGADGNPGGRYDKVNLVPFGEHTPDLFQWVGRITSEAGTFRPGTGSHTLPVARGEQAGVFICYESVFPHYVRQFVQKGATVLINASNDGYFGRLAGREQHLLLVRMRAAENRRWLLRPTNDGVTASIDPAGRIDQQLPPLRKTAGRMRFSFRKDTTPYTQYGDWFVWGCLMVGCGLAGWLARSRHAKA